MPPPGRSDPKGFTDACPICGLNRKRLPEHRAVAPEEGLAVGYILRHRSATGWKYTPVQNAVRTAGAPRQYGPSKRTCEKINRAAALSAQGYGVDEVAEIMKIRPSRIKDLANQYPKLWATATERTIENCASVLREQANTDAVLQAPWLYAKMGEQVLDALAKQGKELFPAVNGELRLSDILEKHYLVKRAFDASPAYRRLLRTTVRRWQIVTGDPSVMLIDDAMLCRFRNFLMLSRGQAPGSRASTHTVKNYMRYIQSLLDMAGPRGRGNRDGLGIVASVPYAKQPKADFPAPKIVMGEHLNLVYRKASVMLIPQIPGIEPADWWRALLVFTYNTGQRRRTLFGLEWKDVDLERALVNVPTSIIKTKRASTIPLNETTVAHLRRIKTDCERVFHWPYHPNHFHIVFARLQWAAGIPEKDHFGLHGIRKTAATALWEHSPAAAQLVMGHTEAAVTMKHYVQGGAIMRAAINGLPQPSAFTGGANGS